MAKLAVGAGCGWLDMVKTFTDPTSMDQPERGTHVSIWLRLNLHEVRTLYKARCVHYMDIEMLRMPAQTSHCDTRGKDEKGHKATIVCILSDSRQESQLLLPC